MGAHELVRWRTCAVIAAALFFACGSRSSLDRAEVDAAPEIIGIGVFGMRNRALDGGGADAVSNGLPDSERIDAAFDAPFDAGFDAPFDVGSIVPVDRDAEPCSVPTESARVCGNTCCARHIAAGEQHTCLLDFDGKVFCWGANDYGQLGDGTTVARSTPVRVAGLPSKATALIAGRRHTCVLVNDGSPYCWGDNSQNALGVTGPNQPSPIPVAGVAHAKAMAAGEFTCVLEYDVACWGGFLFSAAPAQAMIARLIPSEVQSFASGWTHACVLTRSGGVKCWGTNSLGELGTGDTSPAISTSARDVIDLGSSVASVGGGPDAMHTCAIRSDGGVSCWGSNSGDQLGIDRGSDPIPHRATPVDVAGLRAPAVSVVAGGAFTCALLWDGGVQCWGENLVGELGNGTTTSGPTPVDVDLPERALELAAGAGHACAILAGGQVVCWGWNEMGQLGAGYTSDFESRPRAVEGL